MGEWSWLTRTIRKSMAIDSNNIPSREAIGPTASPWNFPALALSDQEC